MKPNRGLFLGEQSKNDSAVCQSRAVLTHAQHKYRSGEQFRNVSTPLCLGTSDKVFDLKERHDIKTVYVTVCRYPWP